MKIYLDSTFSFNSSERECTSHLVRIFLHSIDSFWKGTCDVANVSQASQTTITTSRITIMCGFWDRKKNVSDDVKILCTSNNELNEIYLYPFFWIVWYLWLPLCQLLFFFSKILFWHFWYVNSELYWWRPIWWYLIFHIWLSKRLD